VMGCEGVAHSLDVLLKLLSHMVTAVRALRSNDGLEDLGLCYGETINMERIQRGTAIPEKQIEAADVGASLPSVHRVDRA
jgi:hypothetical protein